MNVVFAAVAGTIVGIALATVLLGFTKLVIESGMLG